MDMRKALIGGLQGAIMYGLLMIGGASALDLPSIYRVSYFQDDPIKDIRNWQTAFSARIGYGETHHSFDSGQNRKPLMSAYGPFNMIALGRGVQVLDTKTVTRVYWNTAGTGLFDDPNPNPLDPKFRSTDGLYEVGGRFRVTDCDLTLQQDLGWGFYIQGYLPIRNVKIDRITAKNLGAPVVNTVNMNYFINNQLPQILSENGFKSQTLFSTFKKTDYGDLVLSAGWHIYKEGLRGMVDSMGGMVQAGALLPTAAVRDEDLVYSIPIGYGNHYGGVIRATAELGFWKVFKIGVQAGTVIFFTDDKFLRMMTDKSQAGWIFLDKGYANKDTAGIWDVGGFLKFDGFVDGFAVIAGYSFTSQGETRLHVKDDNFLKRVITKNEEGAFNRGSYSTSKDDIVNTDRRLREWETQALHFVLQYQPRTWSVCPLFKVEYDTPIFGQYSWATDVVAGTLGVTVTWDF